MSDWFYLDRGNKIGPVSSSDIATLFNADKIDRETHVWNATMKEWKVITETELNTIFPSSQSPPIPPTQINNNLIWIVALLPVIAEVLKQIMVASLGHPFGPFAQIAYDENLKIIKGVFPILFLAANIGLCWKDEALLAKSGYNTKNMMWAAVFLVPAYLFWRANKLKQFPWYAITWFVAVIFSIAL